MRPKKNIVLITDDFALRFALKNNTTFNILAIEPLDIDSKAIAEFMPMVVAIDKRRDFPIDPKNLPGFDREGNVVKLLYIWPGPGRYAELTASVIENLKIMAAVRKGPKCVRLDEVYYKVIKPVR